MKTSVAKYGLAAAFVLVAVCSSEASLITDVNGMNGGTPGTWQNSARFQSSNNKLCVDVEFAVYAPGQFGLSYASWIDPNDPAYEDDYVYAYQIFNNLSDHPYKDDPVNISPVRYISIGLDEGDDVANLDSIDDADPNTKTPTSFAVGDSYARSYFGDPNDIEYGFVSEIYFFSSPYAPDANFDTSTVMGLSTSYKTLSVLPTPNPEPATIGLLGAGFCILMKRRARRKS